MTDLTKLAEQLDAFNELSASLAISEAARILRSAAAVDVAGLMAMADRFAKKEAEWAHGKESAIARAALESALRLALAAREGFVMVPVEPTPDMLEAGAGTKYEKRARNVWRDMIAAAAPKGTT